MSPQVPASLDLNDRQVRGSRFRNVDLSDAAFTDVNLVGSTLSDVDFSASSWRDVTLRQTRFTNVDFGDVEIQASRIIGMRIDGILVTELLEAYRAARGSDG